MNIEQRQGTLRHNDKTTETTIYEFKVTFTVLFRQLAHVSIRRGMCMKNNSVTGD